MEEKPRQLQFTLLDGSVSVEEAQQEAMELEESLLKRLLEQTFARIQPELERKGRTGKKFRSRVYVVQAAGLQTISRRVVSNEAHSLAVDSVECFWTFVDAESAKRCFEMASSLIVEMSLKSVAVSFSREAIGVFQKPDSAPLTAVASPDAVALSNFPYLEPEVDVSSLPTREDGSRAWDVGGGHSIDCLTHLLHQVVGQCSGLVVTELALIPCTSGAYVTFESPNAAKVALTLLHGKVLLPAATAPNARQVPLFAKLAQRRDLRNLHAADCNCIRCVPVCQQRYEPGTISGLFVKEEFLSEDEEAELLQTIEASEWAEPSSQHENMQRRVQHYGYAFDYNTRSVDVTRYLGPLPEWAEALVDRMMATGWLQDRPDQLTINEYIPGQGIRCHVDTHSAFMREITSVSLGSPVAFNMFSPSMEQTSVWVRNRALLVMTEEARYSWKHSIGGRKYDPVEGVGLVARRKRLSLTFRAVNKDLVCKCRFPDLCDTRGYRALGNDEDTPQKEPVGSMNFGEGLEQDHVVDFYETVAEHFSSTRHSPWPNVKQFLEEQQKLQPGCLVGDLGCGNGKYLKCVRKPCVAIGSDISSKLVEICQKQGHQACTASSLALPFRSNCFDVALCIAVLHHISTPERRRKLVEEMVRVMRPGAIGLVYAWAFEQQVGATGARKFDKQDCFVPWHLPVHYLSKTEEMEELPCKGVRHEEKRTVELQRYCHLFQKGEVEQLLEEVSGVHVERSYYDQSNWCVVFRTGANAP